MTTHDLSSGPHVAPAATPIRPERRAVVDRAREGWIRRLIDVSRNNNLLYFRDLKTGTLDLSAAEPETLTAMLNGQNMAVERLLPAADARMNIAKLVEIKRRAVANLEERGLETLFLSLGMATWPATDSGRPTESAVLLVPVDIESHGRGNRSLTLKRVGEAQVNLVLLHVLESEYSCQVSPEQLLQDMNSEDVPLDPLVVYERLRESAQSILGFEIKPRAVLGNFSYQKMAMVKDLRESGEAMAGHDLIAAIAGDGECRAAIAGNRPDIDPAELDRTPPAQEFTILDADSSQQKVITLALRQIPGVIQGPPGTGKSQTIANLIAALAAEGRRVLFVAEKRAALEVVLKRLELAGLGHLALDLHGADISRREIMRRIAENLSIVRDSTPINADEVHQRFGDRRRRLNEHVERLHRSRPPSGLNYFELQGRILRMPLESRTGVRWRGAELAQFTTPVARDLTDLFTEAAGFGGLFLRDGTSPWSGANLPNGAAAQQVSDAAIRVASESLPALISAVGDLARKADLPAPQSFEDARATVALIASVTQTLGIYAESVFQPDLKALAERLAPARSAVSAAWNWATNREYRKTLTAVRLMRRGQAPGAAQLLREISVAANQQLRWRSLAKTPPVAGDPAETARVQQQINQLGADLMLIQGCLGRTDLVRTPFSNLSVFAGALATESTTAHRIPRMLEIERTLTERGAGTLVSEIKRLKPAPSLWPQMFNYAWLYSCLDGARAEDPSLAGFNGQTHDVFVDEFQHLDEDRIKLSIARVRRLHAEHVIEVLNAYPDETALIRRESEKKARHLPLRKVLAQAPHALTAVCPCWMASPLSVSQLLDSTQRYFDVVIFDEASQVLPEDAVASLLRADQAIVAGDKHQLPPTTFFAAGDDDIESNAPAPTEGFESILDLMSAFLEPWSLEWHYRSRDESLIAFSNHHIYSNRLVTFPGTGGPPVIAHVLVNPPPAGDGESDSSAAEVQRVVELIIAHAQERPDETLGVIAMGINHANRIQAALDRALDEHRELDAFFDQSRPERFFVKNLERVQGDERDAIILTIGYGKDRSGRLLYRFGPLLNQGGERRLNVAITRARNRLTLVSAFDHTDMDPNRSTARGVELLRLYIQYAASRGSELGDTGRTNVPINSFEADIMDALEARGVPLIPQWGVSRYRIDFIAQHPSRPGRFVLAIECDGATYHSTPTARDRDRLRQQHLEALGWRFHRIWSTDWFMRREQEIQRAVDAYHAAVAQADDDDAQGTRTFENRPAAPSPSLSTAAHPERRGPQPVAGGRKSIDNYAPEELIKLVRWIESDGRLRTDDEILREAIDRLGFRRRGSRIDDAIRKAMIMTRTAKT